MNSWPHNNSFDAFREKLPICNDTTYCAFFKLFKDEIKVKRETSAVKNLELIFNATFELAHQGSFDAMSLRDLSQKTGISMGGLYNYISSKDNIAEMAQAFLSVHLTPLAYSLNSETGDPRQRLEERLRTYVYMSSLFRPWYRFVFMEAKAMASEQKDKAKQFDLIDTANLRNLIEQGIEQGQMSCSNPELAASALMALIQDWYLKSWKFHKNGTSPDDYADFLVSTMDKLLACKDQNTPELSGYNAYSVKNHPK